MAVPILGALGRARAEHHADQQRCRGDQDGDAQGKAQRWLVTGGQEVCPRTLVGSVLRTPRPKTLSLPHAFVIFSEFEKVTPPHAYLQTSVCMQIETGDANSMENLYSIDEAAKRLGGISRHTVVCWLSQGKLRRTKVGNRTMIAESELERILNPGGISRAPGKRKDEVDPTELASI